MLIVFFFDDLNNVFLFDWLGLSVSKIDKFMSGLLDNKIVANEFNVKGIYYLKIKDNQIVSLMVKSNV